MERRTEDPPAYLLTDELVDIVRMAEDKGGGERSLALQALAWILPAPEFAEQVRTFLGELEEPRRHGFLVDLGYIGNYPEDRQRALYPVMLAELRAHFLPESWMTSPHFDTYRGMLDILAGARYLEAIPYVMELANAHRSPYSEALFFALPRMGLPAVPSIRVLMEDRRMEQQLLGIEMLPILARLDPVAGFTNPVTAEDFLKIKREIDRTFLPLLRRLSEDRSKDERVRDAARTAIQEIMAEKAWVDSR